MLLCKNKLKIFSVILSLIVATTFIFPIRVSAEATIDQMLLKSQEWLNDTYGDKVGFGSVVEDGISRRSTVNACIRALQIELGITETANNFGNTTVSYFNAQYPNGVIQQEYPSDEESNIYGIIQCALWTKGYSTGANFITKHFYDGTGNAIIRLKSDMGFTNSNSTVTLDIMKALLSMNYYVTVSGGSSQIRQIQQEINRTYSSYVGIIPCDGVYTRSMNKALIVVLQAVEGYSVEDATGNFGNGTKANLPLDLEQLSFQNVQKYYQCIKLIQYALCCNGYGASIDLNNTNWNNILSNVVREFQGDMNIYQTGTMNVDTWMALLLSKGNPDRSCVACDTRFEMTQERIDYLKANGYTTVGRYLTGGDFKQLREDEPKRILNNGLSFFPIFQESGTDLTYFTASRGSQDAITATNAAQSFSIPNDNIIYFAVDTDPTDYQIQTYILPYFEALSEQMTYYQIGVYGTRNVCAQVMDEGYAVTCFVSDMSTGYSGNMGFKMPGNWNLDQFAEIQVTTASGTWDLDKVSYSGKFSTVTKLSMYKHGNTISINGRNIGDEFSVPDGATLMRYKIVLESTVDPAVALDVSLEKHVVDVEQDINEFVTMHRDLHLTTIGNDEILTCVESYSDWMSVSDLLGYRFQYYCYDLNSPVYDEEPSYSMFYEDGQANVSVYLEFQY